MSRLLKINETYTAKLIIESDYVIKGVSEVNCKVIIMEHIKTGNMIEVVPVGGHRFKVINHIKG